MNHEPIIRIRPAGVPLARVFGLPRRLIPTSKRCFIRPTSRLASGMYRSGFLFVFFFRFSRTHAGLVREANEPAADTVRNADRPGELAKPSLTISGIFPANQPCRHAQLAGASESAQSDLADGRSDSQEPRRCAVWLDRHWGGATAPATRQKPRVARPLHGNPHWRPPEKQARRQTLAGRAISG